jgi:deoxyribodipyrimidine photo-lyase
MYWGKQTLQWTKTSRQAFEYLLHLNNKYSLDGSDPNSYAGVAWIFGKHDRAFKERNIYGKVRYMNANGLIRKFNIQAYVNWVNTLKQPGYD